MGSGSDDREEILENSVIEKPNPLRQHGLTPNIGTFDEPHFVRFTAGPPSVLTSGKPLEKQPIDSGWLSTASSPNHGSRVQFA